MQISAARRLDADSIMPTHRPFESQTVATLPC
jgi:hypothetical protein